MGRLKTIDPATAQGPVKEIFDGPLQGKHLNIFKALGNSPAALNTYLGIAGALSEASLNAAEREVIQLAIGEANGCDYCTAAHTKIAQGAGLTEEQTIEARRGSLSDDRLNAIAQFALAIHEKKGFVSDEDVNSFKEAGFDDGHIAEVVATYALAVFTNYFNHVNETEVDFPAAAAV